MVGDIQNVLIYFLRIFALVQSFIIFRSSRLKQDKKSTKSAYSYSIMAQQLESKYEMKHRTSIRYVLAQQPKAAGKRKCKNNNTNYNKH